MQRMLRLQIACWTGFLLSGGILTAQQANNPSDQFSTLGRRATTINQDVRQGPSNGTIVNENNGAPTGNNGAGNGAGQGGPGIMANYEPPVPANTTEDVSATPITDSEFARRIVEHGFLKAELGKIAVEKGQSEQVRNIGQAMVDDHVKWAKTLQRIASNNNFALPDKVSSRYKARIDRLRALSGPEFDRAFLKDVVRYQQADLTLMQREASSGTVQPLRNWASKAIPGLERRIEVVKEEAAGIAVAQNKR